jgi:hypothetical protein
MLELIQLIAYCNTAFKSKLVHLKKKKKKKLAIQVAGDNIFYFYVIIGGSLWLLYLKNNIYNNFFFNVDVRVSLYVPRLILQVLKLTII